MFIVRKAIFSAVLLSSVALSPASAFAETITGALAKAYQFNSTLNSARAGVRVTDENVALAKSGYRPTIAGSASTNYSSTRSNTGARSGTVDVGSYSIGIQINQTIFDGFQTRNNVSAAEAQVRASNYNLLNTEQNILYNAAAAYMDVIRTRQIASLTEQNLQFLTEQVRAARSRFDVGEGTRTDVAQAEASRSQAVANVSAARAQASSAAATYRQIVGEEPGKLNGTAPLSKMLPRNLNAAMDMASAKHPAILATQAAVDAASFSVKSAEGALLPQLSASAGLQRNYSHYSPDLSSSTGTSDSASVGATLTIPLYQGGRVSATVRQNKENLGQARIEVDVSRDSVRQTLTSSWSTYTAAQESVVANRDLVNAARLALNGVIEERNVGQRTTLDVLNAQADVISAQIEQANAERDVVVASYAILLAVGELNSDRLGLQVTKYNPREHYDAVKDKWIGLRTPDGR